MSTERPHDKRLRKSSPVVEIVAQTQEIVQENKQRLDDLARQIEVMEQKMAELRRLFETRQHSQ